MRSPSPQKVQSQVTKIYLSADFCTSAFHGGLVSHMRHVVTSTGTSNLTKFRPDVLQSLSLGVDFEGYWEDTNIWAPGLSFERGFDVFPLIPGVHGRMQEPQL